MIKMIDLEKLVGDQRGEAWVKFGKNFELLIAYLPKRKAEELKTKGRESLLAFMVRGWRGLTGRVFVELTKVNVDYLIQNVSLEDFDKEIPYSREGLAILLETVYGLEEYLRLQCTNHELFQPTNWESQLKNSGSGENLSSPHEKKPVQNA